MVGRRLPPRSWSSETQQIGTILSKSPGTHCPILELRGNNLVELRIKANSDVT
jgi:hypothetical protein